MDAVFDAVNNAAIQYAQAPNDYTACQQHFRNVYDQLGGRYKVEALRTPRGWAGPHVSALVHTPSGPVVLDNGALKMGKNVVPFAEYQRYYNKHIVAPADQYLGPNRAQLERTTAAEEGDVP